MFIYVFRQIAKALPLNGNAGIIYTIKEKMKLPELNDFKIYRPVTDLVTQGLLKKQPVDIFFNDKEGLIHI
jgi:hypothetical protein